MADFLIPLEKLRKIPGLEYAKYIDPYAGSKGNSIRYLSVAPELMILKLKELTIYFVQEKRVVCL